MTNKRTAWATGVVFAANGLLLSILAARMPTIRDLLELSPTQMGLVLFGGSIGATLSFPLAGPLIMRFGLQRTLAVSGVVATVMMAMAALAAESGSAVLVAAALFFAFAGTSALDVGMNIQGGQVERETGRSIMPLLHGGWTAGAVVAAGAGSATAALGVGLLPTVGVVAALVLAVFAIAIPKFNAEIPGRGAGGARAARAWVERRTLLIGLVVLAAGLTEGGATDWLALSIVDGFGKSESMGALAYGLFMAMLLAARLLAGRFLERYGRTRVLQVFFVLAAAGLALFVFAPSLPWAILGLAFWGFGASLGFPVGMSAAADDPLRAAARVSVVSTVGYTAFLAGPPILGILAESFGYRGALGFILLPLALSFFALPALRPSRD